MTALPPWARQMVWTEKVDERSGEVLCRPSPCLTNALILLRHDYRWHGILAIDEMAQQMTAERIPPWQEYEPSARAGHWDPDTDPSRLSDWMARAYGIQMSAEKLATAALVVAQDRRFHPVREWLFGLEDHDGTPRVGTFFVAYFGAEDNPYTRAVGRVLLLGLVARAMAPGCKLDTVVVIEGPQGIRKSTACKRLVGDRFFAENTSEIGTKDAQLAMHGKWLLEMPELAGLTRAQVETTKAFFSRASDWLRPPYAKGYRELLRSSVPVATTNDSQYLRDRTGNRRYLPILCGWQIDVESIERDRDQLFAEARELYQSGLPYHLHDPAVLALADQQTERRETVDPWEETLLPWLREPTTQGMRGEAGVTVLAALEKLGVPADRRGPEMNVRIGGIFSRAMLICTRPRDKQAELQAEAQGISYKRPRVYVWPSATSESTDDDS